MRCLRPLAVASVALAFFSCLPVRVASAPADDPRTQARAKEWLERAQTGNVDRSQLTASMSTALTGALVAAAKSALAPLGTPVNFTLRSHYEIDGNSVYVYRAAFKDGAWNEQISFTSEGKISGLYFRPAPDPNETPLPGEEPAITERAKAEFAAWRHGAIDRSHYTTGASNTFTDALVAKVSAELDALGAPSAFVFRGKAAPPGGTIYAYLVTCANGEVWMTLGLDPSGKISEVAFQPE